MSVDTFIDTNIFVYHLDSTDLRKQCVAEGIVRDTLMNANACSSFQVIQECLNTVTRKARIALDPGAAWRYLDTVLAPLMTVTASTALYAAALDLQHRYRYSFYDALILGAALNAGCTRLLSEDLQHGQRIGELTIVNPFLE